MRNFIIILLLCSSSLISNAQINVDSLINHGQIKLKDHNPYPPIIHPDIYIQIDTFNIKVDTTSIKLIEPTWIKKVVIIKEEKCKELFGNDKPVLMILPKKKYKNKISDLFLNK